MKFVITLTDKRGEVERYQKGTIRRFARLFSFNKWKHWGVLVRYGKGKDCFGKTVEFFNEGEYENGKDALRAFKAFIDKQL